MEFLSGHDAGWARWSIPAHIWAGGRPDEYELIVLLEPGARWTARVEDASGVTLRDLDPEILPEILETFDLLADLEPLGLETLLS